MSKIQSFSKILWKKKDGILEKKSIKTVKSSSSGDNK